MLALRLTLERLGLQQKTLAADLGLSRGAVAQWINHERWPHSRDSAAFRQQVTDWLRAHGAVASELSGWWRSIPHERAASLLRPGRGRGKKTGVRERPDTLAETQEDTIMLLRGTRLSADARAHLGLFRDPFSAELREHADLYITPDARVCREAMWQTARAGGMTAIVGESGSGKTTLREDLADRIGREKEPVILIQPYVLDMEERSGRRRTLGARDIAAAIVHQLAPHATVRQDSQARFRQVHQLLADSWRAGNRHCLLIEEAHDLPTPTLRHLKRYLELKEGFAPLLSVILLGQPELGFRLSELDASIREIVQRTEVVHLRPLDTHLEAFLRHKLARQGKPLDEVLAPDAIEALRARLTVDVGRGRATVGPVSLLYPLAVGNLVAAAMNRCADLGLDRVTAGVIGEV